MDEKKEYIGDGVYVYKQQYGDGVKLVVNNGYYNQDTIYMNEQVIISFFEYCLREKIIRINRKEEDDGYVRSDE